MNVSEPAVRDKIAMPADVVCCPVSSIVIRYVNTNVASLYVTVLAKVLVLVSIVTSYMVLLLGLEPRLTANLANRAYKARRATLHYRRAVW